MRTIDGDALLKSIEQNICGGCDKMEHLDFCVGCGVFDAYACIIHAPTIEAEPVRHGQWISVTDKMPEIGQNVLVYAVGRIDGFIGDSIIQICKRYTIKSFPSGPEHEVWSVPFTYFHTDYLITHWMPIPEPPKMDEVTESD